ncbi:hypothetical protein NEOC65_000412 [Neochlamydia sp. AcF65]|nr:hypothetical protein [Neochlamydia sp. AcF65]
MQEHLLQEVRKNAMIWRSEKLAKIVLNFMFVKRGEVSHRPSASTLFIPLG